MPIYEYRCERGHTFEVMQRMTEDPLPSCSTCDAPVQRVFHPVAVHFKGSGFYTTDYAAKGSDATKEKPSAPSPQPEKKDGKPEAKPNPNPKSEG